MKNQTLATLLRGVGRERRRQLKVYGSAGRYSVQIPTNVTVRGASRSIYTPAVLHLLRYRCQRPATGLVQLTGRVSANNEFGQAKDPQTVAARRHEADLPGRTDAGLRESVLAIAELRRQGDLPQAAIDHGRFLRRPSVRRLCRRNNIDAAKWPLVRLRHLQPGRRQRLPGRLHGAGNGTYTKVT